MYAISLLVGPEQGVRDGDLDNLNLAPLGIRCVGQSVICIPRDLVLHTYSKLEISGWMNQELLTLDHSMPCVPYVTDA